MAGEILPPNGDRLGKTRLIRQPMAAIAAFFETVELDPKAPGWMNVRIQVKKMWTL